MANEIFNLNSNLFPCVCVAMYETILSPQFFEDSLNDGEDHYCYSTVDFSDWKTELTKTAQEYINENIIDSLTKYGVIKIQATGIWSPNYYNFHQDELNMDITMDPSWKDTMVNSVESWRNNSDVKKYIATYWHSYSGYINFMPESLDEILKCEDEDRQISAYLTLAMLVEGCMKSCDDVMEDLYYRMEDFSDYHSYNVIYEHFSDELEADKLLELFNDDLAWNDLYWDLRQNYGEPWHYDKECEQLTGVKDCTFQFDAKSEGEKLLFWAVINNYSVEDLRKLAA